MVCSERKSSRTCRGVGCPLRGRLLDGQQVGVGRREVLLRLGDEAGDELAASKPSLTSAPLDARPIKRADLAQERVGRERLGHEARGAGGERPRARALVAARGDDEDRQRAELVLAADELDDLEAADVGHVEVEHDEVEGLEREPLDRLEPARRVRERQPLVRPQARDDHLAHHLAVVDDRELQARWIAKKYQRRGLEP